ncbi:MAG: C1 family peptidase [Spirochaetota bacterium]
MLEEFLLEQADGLIRKITGYKVSEVLENVTKFTPERVSNDKLPAKVDLRPYMTEVEDQTDTNSCTANAVAGAYEYLTKRHLQKDSYDVSRMFIYYNARKIDLKIDDEDEIEDEGSRISSAIKSLRKYGSCSEETWPYRVDKVDKEPNEEAYEEAKNFLVEDVKSIDTDLQTWKSCLAEGMPIIFIIQLYKSFDKHKKPGYVPSPTKKDVSRESHGAHSMLCVGYSDAEKVFIVRNSWGREWGDDGYCYIPYHYIISDHNLEDSWVIKQLQNFDIDEDLWSDDSLFDETHASAFDSMSEEDYADMIDAMGDYSLEYRIGIIMLHVAARDELTEEELEAISKYMDKTLQELNVNQSAKKILKRCKKNLDDKELLQESIQLFQEYLDKKILAKLLSDMEEIVGSDSFSKKERKFVDKLIRKWQVEGKANEDNSEQARSETNITIEVPEVLQEATGISAESSGITGQVIQFEEGWDIRFLKVDGTSCFIERLQDDSGDWISYFGVQYDKLDEDDFLENDEYKEKLKLELGKFVLDEASDELSYSYKGSDARGELEYADYSSKNEESFLRIFYWDGSDDFQVFLYAELD